MKPYQDRLVGTMIVKNAEIPPHSLQTIPINVYPPVRTDDTIYEYTVRNKDQSDIDIRNVKYWFTNYYFFWDEYEIPVLDFTKRYFLTRSFLRVLPYNKNSQEMIQIANAYASLRDMRVKQVDPTASYGFSRQVFPIPPYVVEILVKDQIQKNNACPITMTPFSGIQTFGLTPCFHLFEHEAIQKWRQNNLVCPVCRKLALSIYKYEKEGIEN
jgi:hypothetical protein